MESAMRDHIKYLLKLEDTDLGRHFGLHFDRLDDTTIVVSVNGYKPCLVDFHETMLKLGCNYAFKYCRKRRISLEHFDRMCGKTFHYFTEPPKEEAADDAWECPLCNEITEPATDDCDDPCLQCKITAAEYACEGDR
jgi:hypothetical protein